MNYRSSTLRTYEMLCFYMSGLADEEELLAHIEKLPPQDWPLRRARTESAVLHALIIAGPRPDRPRTAPAKRSRVPSSATSIATRNLSAEHY